MDNITDNETPGYQTTFSKAVLTGVFAGILSTLLTLAFYLIYKDITSFPLSSMINVSSIIFVINTLFLIIGIIYYGFITLFRKGNMAFILLFLLLTVLSIIGTPGIHRSDDQVVNMEFHQLLTGIIIILGLASFAGIPFLFHSRKFKDQVL